MIAIPQMNGNSCAESSGSATKDRSVRVIKVKRIGEGPFTRKKSAIVLVFWDSATQVSSSHKAGGLSAVLLKKTAYAAIRQTTLPCASIKRLCWGTACSWISTGNGLPSP
jgi:hypothetical protein